MKGSIPSFQALGTRKREERGRERGGDREEEGRER